MVSEVKSEGFSRPAAHDFDDVEGNIEIARTSIAQGQEGSAFLVETY